MGTTHFTGLNLKLGAYHAQDGPASTGAFSIVGIAAGDVVLGVVGLKVTATGTNTVATITEANIATCAVTVTANTVTLSGTTAYSGYGIVVLYLDMDAS